VATFVSRYEKALRVATQGAPVEGRAQGMADVVLGEVANAAVTKQVLAPFELFGPGDVLRLGAGAITRRFPAPATSDAEETKLPLVEFAAPDLPWRYTPAAAVGHVLRPWLVLVVGRRSSEEIVLRPDGRVTLGTTVQGQHVLEESSLWAHVHQVDQSTIARIVCPRDLLADTEYVACVVPAFTASGADAWTGAAAVTVDCYDRWTFRTGLQGDFPDLAGKLRKAVFPPGGKPFGRAEVAYVPRTGDNPEPVVLHTAGALRTVPDPAGDPADAPVAAAVAAEVEELTKRIPRPDGRGVVTAPRYDAAFVEVATADAPADGGWVDGLRSDPRSRGAAGLGAWAAIEWQDRISDAAAAKAGDLAIAHDRIRHVALGVEASRSLWRQRMPASPIDRLAVLAPALGRLPTETHLTVLDSVTGRTPQLTRALLSSAGRRAMRPGPARTSLAEAGAGRLGPALTVANRCPEEVDDPADIFLDFHPDPGAVAEAVKGLVHAAAGDDPDLVDRFLNRLGERPSPSMLMAALRALAPGRDGRPDPAALDWVVSRDQSPDPDLSLESWPGWMREQAPPEPCRPIDLEGLANAVIAAVDPTVALPPAARRVLATLPGITHIGPVEIEPELDLPLWSFLSNRSPDWMLPGAGDLPEHGVVGVSTNPAFVQALLVGANHQTAGELRWRNIPMVTRWSPMRKFWQRKSGALDIVPIKQWPDSEPLGSTVFAPNGMGAEAVVVFRTPLFRRYPATVVYLYPMAGDWDPPLADTPLAGPDRKDPTFTGTIGPDITFFGFNVPPSALETHWVVLEEPPAGYRFYQQVQTPPPGPPRDDSANFAYSRFALPVRVLIGPLL
jgi:hypothetical protein